MRTQGSVKFFNDSKGYGFIKPDTGESDIFVHVTALKKSGLETLAEGDTVEFDTEPSRKAGQGPVAVNLTLVKAA